MEGSIRAGALERFVERSSQHVPCTNEELISNFQNPHRPGLEVLILSGSQGEFLNELGRDWLARREGDSSFGSIEPSRGNIVGMRLNGGRREIEAALLTERCITRDYGFSDPEPWHFISDDFFGVRQHARKLSAQSHQQRAEVIRSRSYVGVVISKHGQIQPIARETFNVGATISGLI